MSDDTTSRMYQHSSTGKLSSGGTSNPKPLDSFSVFGEEACGEPLAAQHVVIDFTPNSEDKACIQEKVCSFWKFINNIPEIRNLKVKPEKVVITGDSRTEVAPDSVKSEIDDGEEESVVGRGLGQAAHMLQFAEDKNLINTLFEAKLPQSMCSLGSREYKQSEVVPQPKKKEKKKHVCKCIPCRNPKCRNKRASNTSSEELSPLRALSRKMNEWDAKHPKSMDPPGHPPTLQHCLIQRQMFPGPANISNSSFPGCFNAVYMLTVSCYAFHPLIQRFVRLWRYVQVVSDVITFGLSMLCCQCSDAMPLSNSPSVATKPSIQLFEGYRRYPTEVDPRLSGDPMKPQDMVIDVTPGRGDIPKTQERCQDFWQSSKTRTGTDGNMVEPPREAGPSKRQLIDFPRDSAPPVIVVEQSTRNVPGIHMAGKHSKTGRLKDALQSGGVNRYCT